MSINRDMMDRVKGITLCLANMTKPSGRNRLTIIFLPLIRSCTIEGVGEAQEGNMEDVQIVRMKFSISRTVLASDNFQTAVGDVIAFLPISSLASGFRVYPTIHEIERLPEFLLRVFFGERPIDIEFDSRHTTYPVSRSTTPREINLADIPMTEGPIRALIENEVDPGSLQYVR